MVNGEFPERLNTPVAEFLSQENGDYKLVCVPAHRSHKYICPAQLKLSIYDCAAFWPHISL